MHTCVHKNDFMVLQ